MKILDVRRYGSFTRDSQYDTVTYTCTSEKLLEGPRSYWSFFSQAYCQYSSGVLEQTRNRAYVENPGTDQFLIGGRVVQLRQHD